MALVSPFELLRGCKPNSMLVLWWLRNKHGDDIEVDHQKIKRNVEEYKKRMKGEIGEKRGTYSRRSVNVGDWVRLK